MSMAVSKVADAQRQQELFETIRQLSSTRDERPGQDASNRPPQAPDDPGRTPALGDNAVTGEISPDYAAMASYLMNAATSGAGFEWGGSAAGAAQAMGDYRETVENPDSDAPLVAEFGGEAPQDPVLWLERALERFIADLNGASGLDLRALAGALWEAMAKTGDEAQGEGESEGAKPPAGLQMDLREALIAYLGDGARAEAP